jgi:hypothetical protein
MANNFQLSSSVLAAAGLGAAIFTTYAGMKLYKAGLFQRVLFDLKPVPNDKGFVVKTYKGTYKNIGSKFEELFKIISGKEGWEETVGVYWDDPKKAGEGNCRFSIGVCLKPENIALRDLLIREGYTVIKIEKDKPSLHCTFPFVGTLSVWISLFRVYSACDREMKRRGLKESEKAAVLEITRCGATELYFMLEASNELLKALDTPMYN